VSVSEGSRTLDGSSATNSSSLGQPWIPTPETTPTKPSRASGTKDGFEILTQITDRLNADGVSIKSSTREYLRHILKTENAVYKAQLEAKDATIERLLGQIDKLELKAR
jgi:hypothetical protein